MNVLPSTSVIVEFSASAARQAGTPAAARRPSRARSRSSRERGPGISVRMLIDFVVATQGAYRTSRRLLSVRGSRRSRPRPAPAVRPLVRRGSRRGGAPPEQMALASADHGGKPSVRMVLLKGHDERGFVFYTNRESRKALELEANPWAAACSTGSCRPPGAHRGPVERSRDESLAYFQTRPREPGERVGLTAVPARSRQGGARAAVAEVEQRFDGEDLLPLPPFWGGYRIVPASSSSGRDRPTACTTASLRARRRRLEPGRLGP